VIPVPEQYVVETFYKCVSHPTYNKFSKVYNGSCPFCREGKSFGKKTRFFYIPEKELAFCHNCGYSKKAFNFIIDVTGKPFNIVINEIKQGEYSSTPQPTVQKKEETAIFEQPKNSLPADCINLTDKTQTDFYKDNNVVQIALDYIKKRRLDIAINRPRTFYLSLTDPTHKNRLVLPFYDTFGDIIYYQTRTLLEADNRIKPKYLSKKGAERSLSGIHSIDPYLQHVFLFEGPIDSYFCKNGLAVCGITEESSKVFTNLQQQQIASLSLHQKVWCLDNQWQDKASLKKSIALSDTDDSIFIWPEELKTVKDLNDYCIEVGVNGVDPDFILKNTYKGLKAKLILTKIKCTCT
jgi:hypothetical protein